MKIKITLIAFFASALILSSCMKNEVSPGIESVRTAYAALLNAKAQAEIIIANADAAYTNALAQYQLALAALKEAEAESETAKADSLRADLAFKMDKWAIELDSLQIVYQTQMDTYAAAVVTAKNTLVTNYFNSYVTALTTMRTAQTAVFTKQAAIVALAIDVANGTTNTMPGLLQDLEDAEAALATLEAELADAEALLGDPAAIKAKIAELHGDTTTLQAEILGLLIEQAVLYPDWQPAYKADTTAKGITSRALAVANAAKAAYSAAEATFLTDTVGTHPVPEFWKVALDSVTNTNARLTAGATDTLNSYTLLKNATDTIALGTTDITAALALANDSLAKYADTLAVKHADSVAKGLAEVASRAALAAIYADSTAKEAQLLVVTDSAAAQWIRWHDEQSPVYDPQAAVDSMKYLTSANDSTLLEAQLFIIHNTTIPAAVADTIAKLAAELTATNAYNTWKTTIYDVIVPITTARKVVLTASLATRIARIAVLTAALPDLQSDYLYHQTFMADLLNAVTLAEAYKESVRPDYETWKAAFYDEYVAGLLATYQSKDSIYQAKLAISNDTNGTGLALKNAKAAWTALGVTIAAKTAEKATIVTVLAAYGNADAYNVNYVAAIKALIVTAKADIVTAELAIETAETSYVTKKIDYDKFMIELASLQAELTTAQANVAFWKALLDEAIAAAN
ncbi:MAG: hypothetical protein CVU00_13285 [Bacteroidetes bacterium HGW-Bacteroidetes-17]|nr:MAG: hypothetical protein CVU00_13285 [Bacteroidetes bacterium HGW-Bacteroidetes-17]